MNLRLSQALAKKIKTTGLSPLPLADNPLTDWSTHIFNVSRTRHILVCNTASLYCALMYARGVNDAHDLIVDSLRAIADVMESDGLAAAYQQHVAPGSGEVWFGTAVNRSVTGSMNDLISLSKHWLADGSESLDDVSRRLNEVPMSALKSPDGRPYSMPREVFKALIDGRR